MIDVIISTWSGRIVIGVDKYSDDNFHIHIKECTIRPGQGDASVFEPVGNGKYWR